MPGDYSRRLFRRGKQYSGVLMQQGRVQLDADFNEQLDIALYRTETEAIDVIGRSGVPRHNAGFLIGAGPNNQDLTISAGRIYVDGLLCELQSGSTYVTQPFLPNPDNTSPVTSPPASPPNRRLSLQDGRYIVYLDAWQQERSALDDPLIREVALGGPDTTARLQNVWQVKLLRLTRDVPRSSPPIGNFTCRTQFPEFAELTAPSTGTLNAQTAPPQPEEDPCLLPPTSGFSRLENQLYRIEIQTGGTLGQQGGPVTFKWSRDNASVQTSVISIADDVATVQDTGRDELLSFSNNQWVELYDEESTLKGTPRALVQIDHVQPATREITFKSSLASFSNRIPGLKLRRWDQTDNANQNGLPATPNQWIDVEAGVQVRFSPGTYRSGDYWLIPARTATREIEWPPFRIPNTQPEPQPPRGVRHHFSRLALLEVVNGQLRLSDCRQTFPPLTELVDFFYVGGAGQEAAAGDRLPCPLEVGVTNGRLPVAGARVRFTVPQAGGTLQGGGNTGTTVFVETDANGVAAVQWQLGQATTAAQRCLRVEATLIDEDGTEFAPSLHFNANITTGAEEPGITVRQIVTPDDNNPLRNDTLVAVTRLRRGILITCDQPIAPNIGGNSPDPASFRETAVEAKPTCYVTLDMPWPIGADTNLWDTNSIFGFQPIVLAARVAVNDRQFLWNPTRETQAWLQNTLFTVLRRNQTVDRILCRLTIKGNFIFAPNNPNLNLDGEVFGRPRGDDRIDVQLPSGDNRRGGDLEMWFWITPPEVPPATGLNLTATVIGAPASTALGSIRGTLADSNGAVVPGAVINLFGQIGTRTVTTDASGAFTFPNLPRGTYRISVQVGNLTAEQNLIVT